jgi:hypothetical protein
MIFLAVRLVSLMTHRKCCVDYPFLYHVTDVGAAGIGSGLPI